MSELQVKFTKNELKIIRETCHNQEIIDKINNSLKERQLNYTIYCTENTGKKSKKFSSSEEAFEYLKDILMCSPDENPVLWGNYHFLDVEDGIDNDNWYTY